MRFQDKLEGCARRSDNVLLLTPEVMKMPLPIKRYDDPFFPFGRALIDATRDLVCGYMFDLASYLAIGAAGAIALERTISYAMGECLLVLHGPFSGAGYARISDENAFGVDAVTISDLQDIGAYRARPDRGVFYVGDGMVPDGVGVYVPEDERLIQGVVSLRVFGEEVIYAGSGEDWAGVIREKLVSL